MNTYDEQSREQLLSLLKEKDIEIDQLRKRISRIGDNNEGRAASDSLLNINTVQAFFKLFLNNFSVGVELYDADGYALELNDADLKTFGAQRKDTIGLNLFDNPNIPDVVKQNIRAGISLDFTMAYDFTKASESYYTSSLLGKTVYINARGIVLKDEQGRPFGYMFIVVDNSEIIQQKEESRRSELERMKAQEADKLKSAFLANMSHEIRTPLNAIVGFSAILTESDNNEEKAQYVAIIDKNTDLLLRLITDILDFSKIEAGTLDYQTETVRLKNILIEQQAIHSLKMPDEVQLVCNTDELPELVLQTDYKRITQVVSNLISNAIKFTTKGSISLSYRIQGDCVRVEVEDTGIGIPKPLQKDIFKRFVKGNNFKQGSGLGLTICKIIIESLGGKIGVESTEGAGSCFWFTLPLNPK